MKIKRSKFTVGDLAAFYGVSTDTIRLYDKKGILKAERDNDNDYRLYGKSNFLLMDQIIRLRDMGVSLHDINLIINNNSIEETIDFCRKKIEEYDSDIAVLQRRKQSLESHYGHLKRLNMNKDVITIEKSPCLLIRDFSEGVAPSKKWFKTQEEYDFVGEPFVMIYSEKDAWYKVVEDSDEFSNLQFYSSYYMAARLAEELPYSVSEDGKNTVLPAVMCMHVTTCYETGAIEGLSLKVKNIMDYAEKHNFRLAGPASAWSVFTEKKDGKSIEYYDLWFLLEDQAGL